MCFRALLGVVRLYATPLKLPLLCCVPVKSGHSAIFGKKYGIFVIRRRRFPFSEETQRRQSWKTDYQVTFNVIQTSQVVRSNQQCHNVTNHQHIECDANELGIYNEDLALA